MSIPMSLTTTLNLFELFSFRVHLDNTMFGLCRHVTRRYTVNDVITGWIEIVSAKQKMKSITMSLIRNESFSYLGFLLFTSSLLGEDGRRACEKNRDQLTKMEIMDTIMKADNEDLPENQYMKSDITIDGCFKEPGFEASEKRIPFRMFINEMIGVTPSYTLLNGSISVDVGPSSSCDV